MYLMSEARQQPLNNQQTSCTVFETGLYHDILHYSSSHIDQVRNHTLLHNAEFLESDILIPIHLPGHYNGAILSYAQQSIAVMDPYHTDQHRIVKALQRWYLDEYARFHDSYSPSGNSPFNILKWKIITGKSLPPNLPQQPFTDTWSCGPISCAYLAFWMRNRRLPTIADFDSTDFPDLRKYMVYSIIMANRSMEINGDNADDQRRRAREIAINTISKEKEIKFDMDYDSDSPLVTSREK
jgi:hypothetical protein